MMQFKEKQFKELFLSEFGRMYKAAYILLGDEDEAKDVVQDIFAKLWEGTISLREESQRTFLLTCVRNRCLNIIAHRQTHQEAVKFLVPKAIESGAYDEEIIEAVKEAGYKKVILRPFMVVAGDHANNDMAGNEDDSHKVILEKMGFRMEGILREHEMCRGNLIDIQILSLLRKEWKKNHN